MTDKLKSDVVGLEYPVDALKEVYIKSGRTSERIAKMFGISVSQLLEYVEHYGWEKLKQDHEKKVFFTILNQRSDSFLENLTTDQREQQLKNYQRNQELDEMEEHLKKYGHLFCVDETGEVLKDRFSGMPVKLRFGSSKDEIASRLAIMASIEASIKHLIEDRESKPKLVTSTEVKQLGSGLESAKKYLEEDDD